ncbi:hypothetical protein PFICI_08962 [Pestalotiopsis fici W106-1]|uniref:Protein kinase domain-containing protein n=1 Tax=Pestalotiopsis fici (strain W106-1 / CGMCC3.15140) TaxID=1229662 RepID=W3WZ97_PESFW|nr:uncharacterized protein PFICI_08962 [Pestalotiopsis fici W106-1]ETS79109.1 hypothetical protein PFICI_08962 [Pestalotiopsis fici W106-1]
MVWWDTKLVAQTVTREFVASRLHSKNVDRLDQVLGFGNGLTDETYWEWIEAKSKRIFLILEDVGIPDQIFGAVDHSWEDDDVPIPLNDVDRVTGTKDQKTNWKFWDRQFYYVMREVEEGRHMTYGDDEIVPVDIVDRKQAATALVHSHHIDKVVLSNKPNRVLGRLRIPISKISSGVSQEEFLKETRRTSYFHNEHIISYFASYTHLDSVCVLTTAWTEYSLKTALTNIPASLKTHLKHDPRVQVMNWIHCLADAICYLHSTGGSHGNIKPSSVGFDQDHKILLTDRSILSLEGIPASTDRTAFNKESYDYAAPEQWFRPTNCNNLYNNINKSVQTSSSASSSSSGSYAISINKGGPGYGTAQQHQLPQLDPQAADIFSMGCIMLELMGFLFSKRTSKSFAAHRGDKHRHAGRGGAPLDASFHKNLGQVESWMVALAKDAGKKKDDAVLRGVAPVLQMVARMLSVTPQDRPSAYAVERHIYQVLTEHCGIAEPHCVHQYEDTAAFIDLPVTSGLESLRIGTGGGGRGAAGTDDESIFSIATSSRRVSRQGRSSLSSTRTPTTPTMMTGPPRSQTNLDGALAVPRGHRGMQRSIAATAQQWGVPYTFEDAAQTS